MEEKNYSLLTAAELADLLREADPEDDLDRVEGELIARIKSGECDVSILDGIDLPSMHDTDGAAVTAVANANPFILPGAYAFPCILSIIIIVCGIINAALGAYSIISALSAGQISGALNIFYYVFTEVLVAFGKYLLAGIALHLLTDIAYNTFRKAK